MGPYPLNADVFEHLPHKVGDSAHNTVGGEIGMTGLNEGHVVRHISVPESEERVLDTVDRLARSVLAERCLLANDSQIDEIAQIGGA